MGSKNTTAGRALARPRRARPADSPPPGGLVVGTLCGFAPGGEPLVAFPANPTAGALPARAAAPLTPADLGAEVVLGFEGGDLARPLVLGRLWSPGEPAAKREDGSAGASPSQTRRPEAVEVQADGQRVVISADQEVVLRCGEASITLTRAGKIILRGTYLLSRSSGVNRIKGGSVQIN
jgi:hypothetical protein